MTHYPKLRELVVTYRTVDVRARPKLQKPEESIQFLEGILALEPSEVFGFVALSSQLDVLAWVEVSRGGGNMTVVSPREVFQRALLADARSIILAHNHPSGDTEPSEHDLALTARMKAAGTILGIEVLDHVIVTGNRWLSFNMKGLL